MNITETISRAGEAVSDLKARNLTLGFVPTMGALHEGHLSLVRRASLENDRVAVSIFVNPIQFNNPADLEKYPRDLGADLRLLEPFLGPEDLVFAPSPREMYPEPDTRTFDFGPLAEVMEGRFRPGHFNGVGIVVDKLFRIIRPGKAYFGEKDFQQLAVIRRLTAMERHPVEIVPCPIIREPDGLAMSSRNIRLTTDCRMQAPLIYKTLREAAAQAGSAPVALLREQVAETLEETGLFKVEYVEFADEETLLPVTGWDHPKPVRLFIALFAGEVRLIDNVPCNKTGG